MCSRYSPASSSNEVVKQLIIIFVKSPVVVVASSRLLSLYLTSFILRARYAQLTLYRSKGRVEVDQAESYRPLCLRSKTVLLPPQHYLLLLRCFLAAVHFFSKHSCIPNQCKDHPYQFDNDGAECLFLLKRTMEPFFLVFIICLKE